MKECTSPRIHSKDEECLSTISNIFKANNCFPKEWYIFLFQAGSQITVFFLQ